MMDEELDLVTAADHYRVLAGSLVHMASIGDLPCRHDSLGRLQFERSVLESRFARRARSVNLSQRFC